MYVIGVCRSDVSRLGVIHLAEIYKVPKGVRSRGRDKLNYVAAHHVETQSALEVVALETTAKAQAVLDASKVRTGASQVHHEAHDVDHYVVLESSQGFKDAYEVEFGHGAKAVAPLRKAGGFR